MGTAYTVQSRGESKVMIPYPNYRILRVHRNSRVESAGKHVRWLRLRDADLAVSVSRRRVNVHLFLHGKFASERLWLRRRDCGGRVFFDIDRRDLPELLRRDPLAEVISDPSPEPWGVVCEKRRL